MMQSFFDNLTGIGFSTDEAEREIVKALEPFIGTGAFQDLGKALDAVSGGFNETLPNFIEKAETAADATSDMADAAQKATASLTNVPTGYKIVQARLASIANDMVGVGGAVTPATDPSNIKQVTINIDTVQAENPEELIGQIQASQEWANMLLDGTTQTPSYVQGR